MTLLLNFLINLFTSHTSIFTKQGIYIRIVGQSHWNKQSAHKEKNKEYEVIQNLVDVQETVLLEYEDCPNPKSVRTSNCPKSGGK